MLTTCFSVPNGHLLSLYVKHDSWSLKKFAVKSIKVLGHAADSIARWTSAPVSLPRFGCLWCVRMRVPLPKESDLKKYQWSHPTYPGKIPQTWPKFPTKMVKGLGGSSRWPLWVRSLWISPTWYVVHKSFLFETCDESKEVDESPTTTGEAWVKRVKLLIA